MFARTGVFRTLLFSIFAVSTCLWAADDPLIGTWKLNLGRSRFNPGPPPKSSINRYESLPPDGVRFIQNSVDARGRELHVEYSANYDGRDYAIEGDPSRDRVAMKRLNEYTTALTSKKGGRVTTTTQRIVSQDGRTLIMISNGTNAQGQRTSNVLIYDKQ